MVLMLVLVLVLELGLELELVRVLVIVLGEAAYTARLEVNYQGGVPVDTPVWFRAWEQERDGRKITVSLIVAQDSGEKAEPLITAKGLFIIPPKDDD